MKNYLIIYTISLLALILAIPSPVSAGSSEAEATASLVLHMVEPDTRASHLRAYLAFRNSPLTQDAEHFVEEADRNDLDWRLVAAIAGVESTFGKQIPTGSYNAWGWGIPTGSQSGIGFRNWKDGISAVSVGLKQNYINRGAITLNQIGRIYAASPAWSWKVRFFIEQITEFSPMSPELLSVTI